MKRLLIVLLAVSILLSGCIWVRGIDPWEPRGETVWDMIGGIWARIHITEPPTPGYEEHHQ